MFATDVGTAAATWRPQLFGNRRAGDIADPLIEPLWTGPRVLALVDHDIVRLTDADGVEVSGHEEIREDLAAGAAATMLIEAYLTPEPIRGVDEIVPRDEITVPRGSQALSQMFLGRRGPRAERFPNRADEAPPRSAADSTSEVALVAVDLLWLDDDALLDVPLLERKRILESVLPESYLIRRGVHVRPPVDTWLGSWRAFGFSRLAYKAANSRYVPGEKNQQWATAQIPLR